MGGAHHQTMLKGWLSQPGRCVLNTRHNLALCMELFFSPTALPQILESSSHLTSRLQCYRNCDQNGWLENDTSCQHRHLSQNASTSSSQTTPPARFSAETRQDPTHAQKALKVLRNHGAHTLALLGSHLGRLPGSMTIIHGGAGGGQFPKACGPVLQDSPVKEGLLEPSVMD